MRGVFSILLALFPFVAVAADTESAEIARPNLPDLTSEELADASCSEDDASCGDPEPVATGEPGSDEDSGVKYYRGNGGAYDGEPPIDIGPSSSLLDFLDDSLLDEEVLADIRENMLAGKLVVIRDAFKVRSDQQLGYKLHVLNNTLLSSFYVYNSPSLPSGLTSSCPTQTSRRDGNNTSPLTSSTVHQYELEEGFFSNAECHGP